MRLAQGAGTKAAVLSVPAHSAGGRGFVRRSPRPRRSEQRTKTARVAVVLSLFLVMLGAALLIGDHAVIDQLLRAATVQRETHRIGDIVFTMPDGVRCRHLSFDNKTAELSEGAVEQCVHDLPDQRAAARGFAWGTR